MFSKRLTLFTLVGTVALATSTTRMQSPKQTFGQHAAEAPKTTLVEVERPIAVLSEGSEAIKITDKEQLGAIKGLIQLYNSAKSDEARKAQL